MVLTLGTDSSGHHVALKESIGDRFTKRIEDGVCEFKAKLDEQCKELLQNIAEILPSRQDDKILLSKQCKGTKADDCAKDKMRQ